MTAKEKISLSHRLNIIKGQIDGVARLIEKGEDCAKIARQFHAIEVALKRVVEIYLRDNLDACLTSIKSRDKKTVNFLLKEIIERK